MHKNCGNMKYFYLFVALFCNYAASVEGLLGTTTTYYLAASGQELTDDVTRDESAVHNDLSCASRCADDVSCVTFTVCRQTAGKQQQQQQQHYQVSTNRSRQNSRACIRSNCCRQLAAGQKS